MSVYANILFVHFAAMVCLFIGYGLEWVSTARLRRANTGNAARTWLGTYRISLPLSGPALLVLILSGGYLAGVSGASKEGWVLASILGIVVALGIGFGLVMPRMKGIKAALPEGDAALSADALALVQDALIVALIRIRGFLALGIVYLMTAKPALVGSCAVLFAAMLVGLVFSAGALSKPAGR